MNVIDDKRLNEMIDGMKPFAEMPWGIKFNEFSAKDLYSAMVELRELRAASKIGAEAEMEIERLKARIADLEDDKFPDCHPGDKEEQP